MEANHNLRGLGKFSGGYLKLMYVIRNIVLKLLEWSLMFANLESSYQSVGLFIRTQYDIKEGIKGGDFE